MKRLGRLRALALSALCVLGGVACGSAAGTLPDSGHLGPGDGPPPDAPPPDASPDTFVAAPLPPSQIRDGGPIEFEDVTDAAGLSGAVTLASQHAGGVVFTDLDGDGWPDIFLANGKDGLTPAQLPSAMYHNNGDRTFSDVTARAGLALPGIDTYSAAAGDVDNDGYVDLYVAAVPTNLLLHNNGDGTFRDVTASANAGGPPFTAQQLDARFSFASRVVAMGDFDGDGWLDLVSAGSMAVPPYIVLLRNNGDGTFRDVTTASRVAIPTYGNPEVVLWTDYDNDGDIDLFIWDDTGDQILLRNDGGVFTDVTRASRVRNIAAGNSMGIDVADIDHDGYLDYFVSQIGNTVLAHYNGNGTFTDLGAALGLQSEWGWGIGFQDFDADGWVDILEAQIGGLPNLLYRNRGNRSFQRFERFPSYGNPSNPDTNVSIAFADYDHDGAVDALFASSAGTHVHLLRNLTDRGSRAWLHVTLEGGWPGADNTTGVGARVSVKTGNLVQFRDIEAGCNHLSQSELGVHFGLGDWNGAEEVRVRWPSGRQSLLTNVRGNQFVRVVEQP